MSSPYCSVVFILFIILVICYFCVESFEMPEVEVDAENKKVTLMSEDYYKVVDRLQNYENAFGTDDFIAAHFGTKQLEDGGALVISDMDTKGPDGKQTNTFVNISEIIEKHGDLAVLKNQKYRQLLEDEEELEAKKSRTCVVL